MNKYLQEKLSNILNTDDLVSCDYNSIDNITKNKINFLNVRGSIRMIMGMVMTPKETNDKIDKFLSTSLPC